MTGPAEGSPAQTPGAGSRWLPSAAPGAAAETDRVDRRPPHAGSPSLGFEAPTASTTPDPPVPGSAPAPVTPPLLPAAQPAPQQPAPQPAAQPAPPGSPAAAAAGGVPPRPAPLPPPRTTGAPTAALPRPDPRPDPRAPRPAPAARQVGRSRKARLVVKRIDPWSVFLYSVVASIFLGVALVVAVGLLYAVLSKLGVLSSLNTLIGDVTAAPGTASTPSHFFSAGKVMTLAGLVAALDVVLLTALATLGAFLYNLCASLTGGIEVTLSDRD